jgi:hypothetical protein
MAADGTGIVQDEKAIETGVLPISTVVNAGMEERGLVLGMAKVNEKVRETEQMVELLQVEVVEEKRRRARVEEKMRGTEERVRQLQAAIAEMEEEKRRRVEAEEKRRDSRSSCALQAGTVFHLMPMTQCQPRQKDEITIGSGNPSRGIGHMEIDIIVEGSSAHACGLIQPGNKLLFVNGRDVRSTHMRDIVQQILGPPGITVETQVRVQDEEGEKEKDRIHAAHKYLWIFTQGGGEGSYMYCSLLRKKM